MEKKSKLAFWILIVSLILFTVGSVIMAWDYYIPSIQLVQVWIFSTIVASMAFGFGIGFAVCWRIRDGEVETSDEGANRLMGQLGKFKKAEITLSGGITREQEAYCRGVSYSIFPLFFRKPKPINKPGYNPPPNNRRPIPPPPPPKYVSAVMSD
ncbi:hypothetical protein LCGC14_1770430 [marine sediment metagenome]|uniref:Uncharacterized protein n=1 Tax=marine sediment metagenome TaxID=412755 RepID=A0A0F9HL01_9ZZZZ